MAEEYHRAWTEWMVEDEDLKRAEVHLCTHLMIPVALEDYDGYEYIQSIQIHCTECKNTFTVRFKIN